MDNEEEVLSDLKELLFLSKFVSKPKKIKKERKEVKKMIKRIEEGKFDSLLKNDGDEYE